MNKAMTMILKMVWVSSIIFIMPAGTLGGNPFDSNYDGDMLSEISICYIDGSYGSDSNIGTSSQQAWKTEHKANSELAAGDIVYIGAGAYTDAIRPSNSGSSGNYITYKRDPDASPGDVVISGIKNGIDLRNGQHWGILFRQQDHEQCL